jgi:osmoprotectant transport system permease protein
VALTGAVIGLGSLLPGWLVLKENRLAAGTGLSVLDSLGPAGTAVIVALWLGCLVLSLVNVRRLRYISLGIIADTIVIVMLVMTGLAAGHLLEGRDAAARVSLGAGFWITAAGAYVSVFAARHRLENRPVWKNIVSWSGLIVFIVLLVTGWMNNLSVMQEYTGYEDRFRQEVVNHIRLFGFSVIAGTIIGVPLGIWATRNRLAEKPILFVSGIVQTIPSLALFGFLIPPLSALSFAFPVLRDIGIRGIGDTPAIIALTIYSLLPIVRNTYTGIRRVDPSAVDAGLGMGMSRWQVFRKIEAPLAAPLIMEGVRTASVQAVGLATVAALIGAGGLGWFVFRGIGQAAPDLIILGALPIIFLALIVDGVMRLVIRVFTPRGLTGESE